MEAVDYTKEDDFLFLTGETIINGEEEGWCCVDQDTDLHYLTQKSPHTSPQVESGATTPSHQDLSKEDLVFCERHFEDMVAHLTPQSEQDALTSIDKLATEVDFSCDGESGELNYIWCDTQEDADEDATDYCWFDQHLEGYYGSSKYNWLNHSVGHCRRKNDDFGSRERKRADRKGSFRNCRLSVFYVYGYDDECDYEDW